MPYKDPEKARANARTYRAKNRERRREQDHAYYVRNRDRISAYQKDRRQKNNEWARTRYAGLEDHELAKKREREATNTVRIKKVVIDHYGGRCACCGEGSLEFLSIDHVNGDGGIHRASLSRQNIYAWLRKNNFPDKFELRVLCHNCNMACAHYGYCPHGGLTEPVRGERASRKRAAFQPAFSLLRDGKLGPIRPKGRPGPLLKSGG